VCVKEAGQRAGVRGVVINANIERTRDLIIEADSVQLLEVISNIINNALDAVSDNTGIINVTSEVNASVVSVVIQDNGEGIEKENCAKVFDPFFTTKAKGTGLGLAVCNQIIVLHDGSIRIESEKGKGAAFTVTLPIKRSKKEKIVTH
jgi:signal transduction histidine kinase